VLRSFPRAGVGFALFVAALLACSSNGDETDDNNFREDVIECEDALDRLIACCPGFDASPVLCNDYYHHTSGCGSSTTESVAPALSQDESACIRDRSCEELVADGVCERAQAARPDTYRSQTDDEYPSSPNVTQHHHEPVCR
jgi:hypothetical protein